MASSRPWPFDDDEDRPSGVGATAPPGRPAGHPRPPPRRPRSAAGRYRCGSASGGGAGAGQRGPAGSAQARWRRARAAEWAAWTRTLPWRLAATLGIGAGGGLLGSLLAARLGLVLGGLAAMAAGWGPVVPAQPRGLCLATRCSRRAAHRPVARPAGAARVGGPARPGRPRQPGEHRPLGDRPRWGVRDRLQTVPRPPPARPDGAAVAWPLPAGPRSAGGVVRGRPGRSGPARPGRSGGPDRGRARRPR